MRIEVSEKIKCEHCGQYTTAQRVYKTHEIDDDDQWTVFEGLVASLLICILIVVCMAAWFVA